MATWITHLAQSRRDLEEEVASIYADESIRVWTNEGACDIARKVRPLLDEQYADSQVGVQTYPLPAGTIQPEVVFYDGKRLTRESIADWWASDITATGTPTHYATASNVLYLRPIPDAVATIRYFRYYEPTPIASVTATTAMPFADGFNPLIRLYVKAKALEQAGDPNEATLMLQRYATGLADAQWEQQRERGADSDASPTEVY
jgi:hypothetical protein